jgi:hypothetical protein
LDANEQKDKPNLNLHTILNLELHDKQTLDKPLVLAAYVVVRTHQSAISGYDTFPLCVIHKEGLCPSSGDINRLIMIYVGTFVDKNKTKTIYQMERVNFDKNKYIVLYKSMKFKFFIQNDQWLRHSPQTSLMAL